MHWRGLPFQTNSLPHAPLPHPQNCAWTAPDGNCSKSERYKGLWEIPLWEMHVSLNFKTAKGRN